MNDIIIAQVTYYVSNKKTTKDDVAKEYRVSISTIKKNFKKFRDEIENNPSFREKYYDLYLREKEKSKENEQNGRLLGASRLGSGAQVNEKEIIKTVNDIILNDRTLKGQETVDGVPKSTIYDRAKLVKGTPLGEQLQAVYNSHKGGKK